MKRLIVLISVLCLTFGTANADLVSHWAFDEAGGTTAYDSANGYNGTISGASWTEGIIGGALDFDGMNDYVDFGDIDEFEFGDQDFSICVWFYTQGPHFVPELPHGHIINKYDFEGSQRQWLLYQEETGHLIFYTSPDGSTNEILKSTSGGYQNQWVHMACVRDGSMKYLYINGELDITGTTAGVLTGTDSSVYSGCLENAGFKSRFFNGLIDDIRIYNHALSQEEIQQLIPEPATMLLLGLGAVMLRKKTHRLFDRTTS